MTNLLFSQEHLDHQQLHSTVLVSIAFEFRPVRYILLPRDIVN